MLTTDLRKIAASYGIKIRKASKVRPLYHVWVKPVPAAWLKPKYSVIRITLSEAAVVELVEAAADVQGSVDAARREFSCLPEGVYHKAIPAEYFAAEIRQYGDSAHELFRRTTSVWHETSRHPIYYGLSHVHAMIADIYAGIA